MKEGKEQIKKEKPNENLLVIFKEKEMEAMEENRTYPRAWEHIDPNKLIDGCQKIFDLYKKGDSDSLTDALNKIDVINKKIEKMKDIEEKKSTQKFIEWIDDKVKGARSTALTKEELAK